MILGHIQRSGTPSSFDRLLAARFGHQAIELIAAEQYNQLVVWENGRVQSKPLHQVIPSIKQSHVDACCPSPVSPQSELIKVAKGLGIYIGY